MKANIKLAAWPVALIATLAAIAALVRVGMDNQQLDSAEGELKADRPAAAVSQLGPMAEAGNTQAQMVLAYIYQEGGQGVPKDAEKVRYWAGRLRHNVWASANDRAEADWFVAHAGK
jgi:TPR repeat protein